jgi:hypothetical protein
MAGPQLSKGLANTRILEAPPPTAAIENREGASLLEGELLDLYASLLIVIPIALFLKSLWL